MRDLTSRLREIVRQGGGARPGPGARELTCLPEPDGIGPGPGVAERLGGALSGPCVVVDRLYDGDRSYGRRRLEACVPDPDAPIRLLDRRVDRPDWWRRVVYFDIETTGLSGGAGTLAFLVGCGWFEDAGFRVRQFFLIGPSGEPAMLQALAEVLAEASLLVTYNGRTFDVPFMETRWAFHRTANPAEALPHFDMLPAARRIWGQRGADDVDGGCSLTALERRVLGVHRTGDVPGFEIPARYFSFLRTGNTDDVEGVLEHNRADIVSLAAIVSQALWLAREGPEACREPSEQVALGRLYERGGDVVRARLAFEMAARSTDAAVRRRALAHLAVRLRRDEQYEAAAAAWQEVLDASAAPATDVTPSTLERRAAEALAIHHEHRTKDVAAARRYAEALGRDAPAGRQAEVRRRVTRLNRKLAAGRGPLGI